MHFIGSNTSTNEGLWMWSTLLICCTKETAVTPDLKHIHNCVWSKVTIGIKFSQHSYLSLGSSCPFLHLLCSVPSFHLSSFQGLHGLSLLTKCTGVSLVTIRKWASKRRGIKGPWHRTQEGTDHVSCLSWIPHFSDAVARITQSISFYFHVKPIYAAASGICYKTCGGKSWSKEMQGYRYRKPHFC